MDFEATAKTNLARNEMGRVKRLVLALAYIYLELGVLVSGAIVYPSLVWSFQNPR